MFKANSKKKYKNRIMQPVPISKSIISLIAITRKSVK